MVKAYFLNTSGNLRSKITALTNLMFLRCLFNSIENIFGTNQFVHLGGGYIYEEGTLSEGNLASYRTPRGILRNHSRTVLRQPPRTGASARALSPWMHRVLILLLPRAVTSLVSGTISAFSIRIHRSARRCLIDMLYVRVAG